MMNSLESLSCLICAKEFYNKKSLVRHTSYCRKAIGRVRSRKRACQACTKAKARCDTAFPHCSRCSARSLICHYASDSHARYQLETPKPRTSYSMSQEAADSPVATLGNQQVTNSDLVKSWAYNDYDPYSVTLNSNPFDSDKRPSQLTGGETWEFSDETDSVVQDSLTTLFPRPLRLFVPECFTNSKSPLTQRYLLCTLRSYPVMMLRGQNPPFIHPRTLFDDPGDFQSRQTIKAGPLAVCNEILQMFTMKNGDNVVQIWRAVRMEQERLLLECPGYDYYNTLAALQAISIYLILRIFEKNEEATDFDVPLVQTMLELAIHLTWLEKTRPLLNLSDWQDWILTESKIRTSIFLCIMPFFFDIHPAILLFHQCNGEALRTSRLPSGRNIWQAKSKSEWLREYEMQCHRVMPHSSNSNLTYSNLLDYNLKNDASLDLWLSEIDDFGNFVMAAATLQD
ncbi:hypothetical protein EYB25_007598 [Talaromyces marneffei]|nr:uncharacterized protein EYB26_005133 [Talaromyces marneffei]KAE8549083.1 hypothetical protein EYB25_007598 [Talaromyces marneffei]QGA17462.1 hypothetical protein EYB26_005133 [Talaromyces marneffei]